jgi:hypothetical protein
MVFGGGIAVQRVGYEIWLWELLSCVVTCIFVWFWCPETAGCSLEEIDRVFAEDAKKWPGYKRWHKVRKSDTNVGSLTPESGNTKVYEEGEKREKAG